MQMLTSVAQRCPVPHWPATVVHDATGSVISHEVPVQASVPVPPFVLPDTANASLLASPLDVPVPLPFARSLPLPPDIVFVPDVPAFRRSSPSSPLSVSLPVSPKRRSLPGPPWRSSSPSLPCNVSTTLPVVVVALLMKSP